MKIFWWQAGLHIEPANQQEAEALEKLRLALEALGLNTEEGIDYGESTGEQAEVP